MNSSALGCQPGDCAVQGFMVTYRRLTPMWSSPGTAAVSWCGWWRGEAARRRDGGGSWRRPAPRGGLQERRHAAALQSPMAASGACGSPAQQGGRRGKTRMRRRHGDQAASARRGRGPVRSSQLLTARNVPSLGSSKVVGARRHEPIIGLNTAGPGWPSAAAAAAAASAPAAHGSRASRATAAAAEMGLRLIVWHLFERRADEGSPVNVCTGAGSAGQGRHRHEGGGGRQPESRAARCRKAAPVSRALLLVGKGGCLARTRCRSPSATLQLTKDAQNN